MPYKSKTKRGAWGDEEKSYIRRNAATMSPEDIAKHLNRNATSVARWVHENVIPEAAPATRTEKIHVEKVVIKQELRDSLSWKKLKDEFEDDEIAYFEQEYIALVHQFRDDVLATEEQQIRKAITLDILMRRNMKSRKKLLNDIERVDDWQEKAARDYKAAKAGLGEAERSQREEFLLNLETQLASLRAAEQSKTKEYSDLDMRHQKLMEALKATRDQRISKIESGKVSVLGLLKELAEEERRDIAGQQMALMKRATDKEYERLTRPHHYDDGNEDLPVLSAETIKRADAVGKEEEKK